MDDTFVVRRFEPMDADAVWDVHEAALRASPLAFIEEASNDLVEETTDPETGVAKYHYRKQL